MIDLLIKDSTYEFEGKKYLYIPNRANDSSLSIDNRSLLIAMSTHNFGDRFFMLKSFLNNQKYDLLFVNDPLNTYYLENDYGASYQRLFEKILKDYKPENVSFFGSSMSGYAAINYALNFSCNAIVCNPQIRFECSYEKSWAALRVTLDKVKPYWQDLDKKIVNLENLSSSIYFVFGNHRLDRINHEAIKSVFPLKSKFYFQQVDDIGHGFYLSNVNNVYLIHEMLLLSRKLNLDV